MVTVIVSLIGIIPTILLLFWGWKSELKKERALKYYDLQFEQYNKLWSDLVELQIIADDLWEEAQSSKMKNFISQLKRTKNSIRKYSLIIEENDYQELIKILNNFENYQVGKEKLIKSKDINLPNEIISKIIKNNKQLKENYDELLTKIRKKLKKQLKVG